MNAIEKEYQMKVDIRAQAKERVVRQIVKEFNRQTAMNGFLSRSQIIMRIAYKLGCSTTFVRSKLLECNCIQKVTTYSYKLNREADKEKFTEQYEKLTAEHPELSYYDKTQEVAKMNGRGGTYVRKLLNESGIYSLRQTKEMEADE
ncbi:MAG: hypothetical protein IKR17_05960 [Bacteroidales bacterium]|nr:hypothetical protein [Bacteroidales bacterium]